MENENPTPTVPPLEVPPANPVPANPPPSENLPPPPAARLVHEGELRSEHEIEIERQALEVEERVTRLREEETAIAERERRIQEREDALRNTPPVPVKKVKRARGWTDPVFDNEEEQP